MNIINKKYQQKIKNKVSPEKKKEYARTAYLNKKEKWRMQNKG